MHSVLFGVQHSLRSLAGPVQKRPCGQAHKKCLGVISRCAGARVTPGVIHMRNRGRGERSSRVTASSRPSPHHRDAVPPSPLPRPPSSMSVPMLPLKGLEVHLQRAAASARMRWPSVGWRRLWRWKARVLAVARRGRGLHWWWGCTDGRRHLSKLVEEPSPPSAPASLVPTSILG
jgi:hypothetical protein